MCLNIQRFSGSLIRGLHGGGGEETNYFNDGVLISNNLDELPSEPHYLSSHPQTDANMRVR